MVGPPRLGPASDGFEDYGDRSERADRSVGHALSLYILMYHTCGIAVNLAPERSQDPLCTAELGTGHMRLESKDTDRTTLAPPGVNVS